MTTANTQQLGPYTVDGTTYKLKRLTLRRYQEFLAIFTKLPLETLYNAWGMFQLAIQEAAEKAGAVEGVPEDVDIPTDIASGLSEAIRATMKEAQNKNLVVEIMALALDIDVKDADQFPYDTGLEVVEDFFTDNPALLTDTIAFLTGTIQPTTRSRRSQSLPTPGLARENYKQRSTGSPPKPKKSPGRIKTMLRNWINK